MSKRKHVWFGACAAALGLLTAGGAAADPATGSFSIELGEELPIWSGILDDFAACASVRNIEYCLDLAALTDAGGGMAGGGTLTLDGAERSGTLFATLDGKLQGRGGRARAQARLDPLTGFVSVGGFGRVETRGKGDLSVDVEPQGPRLVGRARIRLCPRGARCENVEIPIEQALASDGSWTLELAVIQPDARRLSGTAIATLADGSRFGYDVRGSYDERRDESTLALKGSGTARGSTILLRRVRFTTGALESAQLGFRLLGQQGQADVTPVPAQ